jgi:hypothetical protein
MKTYFVTVEGVVPRDESIPPPQLGFGGSHSIVSRVERITASNVAEAMSEAKKEFTAKTGSLSAVVVAANEERTNA